jgi:hypothetical protein
VQRAGAVVGFDANGDLTLTQGFYWRGDWATATSYTVNDVFRDPASKNLYVAKLAHMSSILADDVTAGRIALAVNVEDVELAKSAAETARDKASQWSEASENTEVETGQYSAKHHSLKSAASATASASSATASADARDLTLQYRNAAQTAQSAAEDAQAAAEAALDEFDDRWLGPKAANPSADNDGNPLQEGAVYWNTTAKSLRIYNGTAWSAAVFDAAGALVASNNLSDLGNLEEAKATLGIKEPGVIGIVVLTSGTSWTVPVGVNKVVGYVEGASGCGGAGNGTIAGGGGGGGGGVKFIADVVPGAVYEMVIAAAPTLGNGGFSSITIDGQVYQANGGGIGSGFGGGIPGSGVGGENRITFRGNAGNSSSGSSTGSVGGTSAFGGSIGGSGVISGASIGGAGRIVLELYR